MKKTILAILSAMAFGAVALAIPTKAIQAKAEGEEETSEIIELTSEVSVEEEISSEEESIEIATSEEQTIIEQSSEEPVEEATSEIAPIIDNGIEYVVKQAHIGYREDETASYADGDSTIGSYFLSADGWTESETEPIVMTIKGNITTKLVSKIVYIYEYKPTKVTWNNFEVKQEEDKTFLLTKPAEKGEYDLAIYFTKTVITNPVDLVGINWSSFLTVSNLMTIGSWVIIVVGILVMYAINNRYKQRGSTTLQEVKSELTKKVEGLFGEQLAGEFSNLLETTIAPVLSVINGKLEKQDNNMTTLVRCLLLMQENTPEARLAITECLSKLDTSADSKAEEVKKLIQSEIEKYKHEADEREKALLEAIETTKKYAETVEKTETEINEDQSEESEFGDL